MGAVDVFAVGCYYSRLRLKCDCLLLRDHIHKITPQALWLFAQWPCNPSIERRRFDHWNTV